MVEHIRFIISISLHQEMYTLTIIFKYKSEINAIKTNICKLFIPVNVYLADKVERNDFQY